MKSVEIYKKIEMQAPVMLVAWPGMGNAALEAVDYLRRKLRAVPFARIDTGYCSLPEMVLIEKGLVHLPQEPKNIFYAARKQQLIIFESEFQFQGELALELMEQILKLARKFKVKRIYTGAAFPTAMSYREPSQVFGVANMNSVKNSLNQSGVKAMKRGQILGMNGLLLGYAAKRKIEAACLLATLPSYAVNFPNPKASRSIIEILKKLLKLQVDMKEINAAAKEMEQKMIPIEEKIKMLFPTLVKEPNLINLDAEKVPDYVMKKIEKLFQEAKSDRQKAHLLKEELDRWELYNLYEDKFLDLFKEKQ